MGTQPPLETGFEPSMGQIVVKLPFGKMTFAADQGRWKLERKRCGRCFAAGGEVT